MGRFTEPIKAMRGRIRELEFNIARYERIAKDSSDDYQRKLYGGLVEGAKKEIAEFESAITHLESGELNDQASV